MCIPNMKGSVLTLERLVKKEGKIRKIHLLLSDVEVQDTLFKAVKKEYPKMECILSLS